MGFDAENGFVNFKKEPINRLVVQGYLNDLVKEFEGYPKSLLDIDSSKTLDMCIDNGVWDIQNNTVLQLGEHREVKKAYRGFKSLDRQEIKELYGSPPIFSQLKWPETTR